MTKKQFTQLTGYTIEYLDISARSRDTTSTMKLSNGKTYYGEHFGGGYTIAQVRAELFEQVLAQLRADNLGVRTIDDMNKFIALDIFLRIAGQTKDEQKELLISLTEFYNCSLAELYDRLKYYGHELKGAKHEN